MNRFQFLNKCVALVFACASLSVIGVHANERIRIGGTGGGLGTMKRLATVFEKENPGVVVDVLTSLGSSGGIKAVAAGAIDLAISSRPLKDKEKNFGLTIQPYAITAIAIVTGKPNTIKSISPGALANIFDGTTKTWPDGTPIRIVLRPVRDTDTKTIKQSIPELATAMDAASEIHGVATGLTDQDAADYLERIPGSLGFLGLSVIKGEGRRLSVIALDGISPSVEAIESGAYPARKTFYFSWKKSRPSAAQKFIDFVGSQTAKEILEETGHSVFKGSY